jgi:REP element-mobilizing transposase RayT
MADCDRAGSSEPVVQGEVMPRFGEVRIRDRGRLPHWEKEEGLYFVTFRLADSLPKLVLQGITQRQQILDGAKRSGGNLLPSQEELIAKYSSKRTEEYADRGSGSCLLKTPAVAEMMATALRFWQGTRYRLLAWCIMPNHVHVVCRLFPSQKLADVVKSWKVYTARGANRLLGRSGSLWQREYYDRLIRREGELDRAVQYVLSNPEKAGLKNWRWVWSEGQEALSTAGQETGGTSPTLSSP